MPALRRHSLAAACGVLCIALASCASDSPTPTDAYVAVLSGAQEAPPVASAGTGRAELHYEQRSSVLRWRVNYAGLSGPVTAAHIHGPAGPGQNAPAIVPLHAAASPMVGQVRLSPEQANQLESGQWYLNLHTAAHPQGEVRGQVRHRTD